MRSNVDTVLIYCYVLDQRSVVHHFTLCFFLVSICCCCCCCCSCCFSWLLETKVADGEMTSCAAVPYVASLSFRCQAVYHFNLCCCCCCCCRLDVLPGTKQVGDLWNNSAAALNEAFRRRSEIVSAQPKSVLLLRLDLTPRRCFKRGQLSVGGCDARTLNARMRRK